MATTDITKLTKVIFRYGEYYNCLPFRWGRNLGKIILIEARRLNILTFLVLFHFIVSIGRIISVRVHSPNIVGQLEAAIGALVYSTVLLIRFDIPVDHVQARLIDLTISSSYGKMFGNFSYGVTCYQPHIHTDSNFSRSYIT